MPGQYILPTPVSGDRSLHQPPSEQQKKKTLYKRGNETSIWEEESILSPQPLAALSPRAPGQGQRIQQTSGQPGGPRGRSGNYLAAELGTRFALSRILWPEPMVGLGSAFFLKQLDASCSEEQVT